MTLDRKELGTAIRDARMAMGFTQEQLAEMIDITPTHLKQLESGSRSPSIEVLYLLSRILNMSIDAIFFPDRKDGSDLQHKIELSLHTRSVHDLHLIDALITAMAKEE